MSTNWFIAIVALVGLLITALGITMAAGTEAGIITAGLATATWATIIGAIRSI